MADEKIEQGASTGTPPPPTDELASLRNAEGQFDPDKVKKVFESERFNRQQISKLRQMPAKIEEYSENFALDSKYTEFMGIEENQKKIKDHFDKLDKLCLEKGIGVERNHDLRRHFLDTLTEAGVIDLTSESERAARHAEAVGERNKVIQEHIGDSTNLSAWESSLNDWLKNDFCNSEVEFEAHKKIMETNPTWALSLNKIRQALMGNRIPVIQGEAKFSQAEWERAFSKADPETQDRMLKERGELLTKKTNL